MKKQTAILFLIIASLWASNILFAAGNMEQEASSPPVTSAIDAASQSVTVEHPIDSIAIIGKAAIMPADALYLFETAMNSKVTMAKTDQGMGDFFEILVPEEQQTKRLGQTINSEEIVAMDPDLILTKLRNRDAIASQADMFDIPLFALDLETSSAWKNEIVQLGKLLGESERAAEIVGAIEERESDVAQRIEGVESSDVLVLQGSTSDGFTAFSIPPSDWIQTELVKKAGGNPILEEKGSTGWSVVSFEQIAAWDPAYIIIVSYRSKGDSFTEEIYQNPEWQQLRAVKENNLLLAPSDYVNYFQPNSRWILALQWLAKSIHPEQFADMDMEHEVATFYETFYNIKDEETLDHLVSLYRESL